MVEHPIANVTELLVISMVDTQKNPPSNHDNSHGYKKVECKQRSQYRE